MRTFIALDIPDVFRFEIAALARCLEESVNGRFVEPGNYHITLAFLGDVAASDVQGVADVLEASCASFSSVPLMCDGLGKFGNVNDATLWLGLVQSELLAEISNTVREGLVAHGIAFDQKPFKPHITIARRASIPKASFPPLPFPEADYARSVTLFKSDLEAQGAIYTPLHTVDLINR